MKAVLGLLQSCCLYKDLKCKRFATCTSGKSGKMPQTCNSFWSPKDFCFEISDCFCLSESFQMKVLDSSDRMTTSQQNELLLLLKIIRPQ